MHEYRYQQNDYLIWIYFQGKRRHYRVKQIHGDREGSSWHLYALHQVQELRWIHKTRSLTHVTQPGQDPMPAEFIQVLQGEFTSITGVK